MVYRSVTDRATSSLMRRAYDYTSDLEMLTLDDSLNNCRSTRRIIRILDRREVEVKNATQRRIGPLSCRVLALFCAVDFLDFMPPPKLLLLVDHSLRCGLGCRGW